MGILYLILPLLKIRLPHYLLADMANCGEVNLHDALDKYLPSNVTIPEYNGQKITLEKPCHPFFWTCQTSLQTLNEINLILTKKFMTDWQILLCSTGQALL